MFSFGAAPPFGRVGLCRSSQDCSALRKKALGAFLLGLPPRAALLSIPQPRALRALLDQNALAELELPKNTIFY